MPGESIYGYLAPHRLGDPDCVIPALLSIHHIRVMDKCNISAVHAHQIVCYMRNMIGIVSTTIRGQNIYVVHDPEEATTVQVENYLCAAVHPFGSHWRRTIRTAFPVDSATFRDNPAVAPVAG